MATYKVWLTVKDRFGNTKEIEGNTINVDLDELDLEKIEKDLPLDKYLRKDEAKAELDPIFATDVDVGYQVGQVQQQVEQSNSIKYTDFFDSSAQAGGVN
jgi:hypothetical protein